jgi:hypothetical protein
MTKQLALIALAATALAACEPDRGISGPSSPDASRQATRDEDFGTTHPDNAKKMGRQK